MSNPSHFSAGRDSGPSSASVLLWHDGKRTYRVKHRNDWLILLFFAALPVATGLNVWYEVGWSSSTGRALFLGFLFLSALWAAAFYAVKIAIRMVISPSGLTVAHGPWQGHMAWWEISRLLERTRPGSGRRYRWLVAEAGDGRRLQIRDDAVADYERFLADVHAMYRDWREQTTQIGMQVQVQRGVPYTTKEQPKSLVWLGSAAIVLALPGLYLWQAVPHAALVGLALTLSGLGLAGVGLGRWLRTRSIVLDARNIALRGITGRTSMEWVAVSRVERIQHPLRLVLRVGSAAVRMCRMVVNARNPWTGDFGWPRRPPEDLVLRGAGRRLRIRLSLVPQPEILLAYVELHVGAARLRAATGRPTRRLTERLPAPPSEQPSIMAAPPADAVDPESPTQPERASVADRASPPPAERRQLPASSRPNDGAGTI